MKFDLDSCKELTGLNRVQLIEADAKEAAESHRDRAAHWRAAPTEGLLWDGSTYMDTAHNYSERIIWAEAFQTRKNRLDRMLDKDYFIC